MTNPEIAKNLLLHRYSILDHARERAREMGHEKGALFPWRTITGTESSAFFPAGTAQYHISADIAYSYIQYYLATKDEDFMKRYMAEVLFETARLWEDTGHLQNGKFRIDDVTGPDEYTCIVNNNYYTNVMAKHNLSWAAKIYYLLDETDSDHLKEVASRLELTETEVGNWQIAADSMYLPYDETLQINAQDDSFLQKARWDLKNTPPEKFPLLLNYHPLTLYRYQVLKQADTVLAHFLLEDEQDFETIKIHTIIMKRSRHMILHYHRASTALWRRSSAIRKKPIAISMKPRASISTTPIRIRKTDCIWPIWAAHGSASSMDSPDCG